MPRSRCRRAAQLDRVRPASARSPTARTDFGRRARGRGNRFGKNHLGGFRPQMLMDRSDLQMMGGENESARLLELRVP
jgi:hypothetical protein